MPRTLLTAVVVAVGATALAWWWVHAARRPAATTQPVEFPAAQQPDAMPPLPAYASADRCIACHQRETPAIVAQWVRSKHAAAASPVSCAGCHVVPSDHPMAIEHEGEWIMGERAADGTVAAVVTPRVCGTCHEREAKEFAASRHSLPAWAAMSGTDDFKHVPALLASYEAIEEIPRRPDGDPLPRRNALYDIEGPQATPAACERCHSVGRPWAHDDPPSAGRCSACHGRHQFAIEQVRKPETCNNCHIGPDHPQFEIYMESKHGIQYATLGHGWHWSEQPGRVDVMDFPAATCSICHIGGFGPQPTTHDVGDRLSLFLHEPISLPRPNADANRERMQSICRQCHSQPFVAAEYRKGDAMVERINGLVGEAAGIMKDLQARGLNTPKPFDERIDFTAFDLWHHWGRTAKFGAFMQGADYSQWHGIYELLKDLAELKEYAAERTAGASPAATQPDVGPPPRVMRSDIGHGPTGATGPGGAP